MRPTRSPAKTEPANMETDMAAAAAVAKRLSFLDIPHSSQNYRATKASSRSHTIGSIGPCDDRTPMPKLISPIRLGVGRRVARHAARVRRADIRQGQKAAFSRAVSGLVERGLLFSGGLSRVSGA